MPPESASAMATSSDNSDAIAYLISSATQQVKEGQYAFARCYLLTASELAPDNFLIKYETFQLCKSIGSVTEAAKKFADLFNRKALEPERVPARTKKAEQDAKAKQFAQLVDLFVLEMKRLLYATSTEWSEISQSHLDAYLKANELFAETELRDDLPKFYRNMFNQMKPEDQLYCLSKYPTFTSDCPEVTIDLQMFIISKFSTYTSDVSTCAGTLIRMLKSQLASTTKPDSRQLALIAHLRKKYLAVILPAFFCANSSVNDEPLMQEIFFNGLKYYIDDYISAPTSVESLKLQTEQRLIETVRLIGKHKSGSWQLFSTSEFNPAHLTLTLNTISAFSDAQSLPMDLSVTIKKEEDAQDVQQILYYGLVLFLLSFSQYATSGEDILIERLYTRLEQQQPVVAANNSVVPKKRKLMEQYQAAAAVAASTPKLIAASKKQAEHFTLLTRLLKIFRTLLEDDFTKFLHRTNLQSNVKFAQLQVDAALYGGLYADIPKLLSAVIHPVHSMIAPIFAVKRFMQETVIFLKQSDFPSAMGSLLKLIDLAVDSSVRLLLDASALTVPRKSEETTTSPASTETSPASILYCDLNTLLAMTPGTRQLIFLPLSLENVLSFIIDGTICLLKETSLHPKPYLDLAQGHLLVLQQYNWPYYYALCQKTLSGIVSQAVANRALPCRFVYPLFSKYILTPGVLEEFASRIGAVENLSCDLDVSGATEPLNLGRSATRDGTKTAKAEFNNLMLARMAVAVDNIPMETFLDFLSVEIKTYFLASGIGQ